MRQGFLSEMLRKAIDFFSATFQKVASGFFQRKVKVKSKQSDWHGGQGFSQQKVMVKTKQSDRQKGQGSKKLLVWFS
ncbi:hypothetical protein M0802_015304 [Mischocyttarus mexicanus]|nr:hypothetical protein M0802_015304 [Mischocyttarus mexicanus]